MMTLHSHLLAGCFNPHFTTQSSGKGEQKLLKSGFLHTNNSSYFSELLFLPSTFVSLINTKTTRLERYLGISSHVEKLQQENLRGIQDNTMVEASAMEMEACVSQGREGN